MTVQENVAVGLHLSDRSSILDDIVDRSRRTSSGSVTDRCRELLALVGLQGFELSRADYLPYGQQRLLEIARALASEPRLLLLDEPAAGLNSEEVERLVHLLKRLSEGGLSMLIIEHNMPFVMQIANTIIVLDQGRTIATGKPADVRNDPRVQAAYLGAPHDAVGDAVSRTGGDIDNPA
jgi:ABC-type branched-subunit amino acid transport system ATPase component